MTKLLTNVQAVALLRKTLAAIPQKHGGGVKAWAESHGLNYSQVRDVRDGRRPMNDGVGAALGLKRVEGWEQTSIKGQGTYGASPRSGTTLIVT